MCFCASLISLRQVVEKSTQRCVMEPSPLDAPWPMLGRDTGRRSTSPYPGPASGLQRHFSTPAGQGAQIYPFWIHSRILFRGRHRRYHFRHIGGRGWWIRNFRCSCPALLICKGNRDRNGPMRVLESRSVCVGRLATVAPRRPRSRRQGRAAAAGYSAQLCIFARSSGN